jgi:GT2 family glycosyltransferase/glycosyltransferase involved in cell wall biosynthesis
VPVPASAPLRVLVHGDAAPDPAWVKQLLVSQPQDTKALWCATSPVDGVALPLLRVSSTATSDLLDAGRCQFPGEHLALVRSDAELPPFWLPRLLAALGGENVLAAGPLDNLDADRSPLPAGIHSNASADAIDRWVCASGQRRAYCWTGVSPLLSLWHGARLDKLELTWPGSTLPARLQPLHAVLVDHLYVAQKGRGLRGPTAALPGADPDAPSPLGELRGAMAAAIATEPPTARHGIDGKPVLLHVLHGWGGGAERFVRDLAAADIEHAHLVLIARGHFSRRRYGEVLELHDGALTATSLRRLALPRPIADTAFADADYRTFFETVLQDFGVSAVLLSSLIGHSLDALRSGLPTLVIAHDVYPLWPVLHRDFGDPELAFDAAQRAADLRHVGPDSEFAECDPAHWQALRNTYVQAAIEAKATLVAPSRSALHNVLRLAPEWNALTHRVIAHGLAPWPVAEASPWRARDAKRPLRLVVPGRVRRGKGAQLLREVLPALRGHAEIFLLGAGADGMDFFGASGMHVLMNYRREDLPALIADLQPDAALILASVAETFSYTLSECQSLGLPVIATRIGALAERIVDGETGFLVEPRADAIAQGIAQLAAQRDALARVRDRLRELPARTLADMATDFRSLLPVEPRPVGEVSAASVEALRAAEWAAQSTLQAGRLIEQIATSRALQHELVARSEWATSVEREHKRTAANLRQLQGEFAERTQWAKNLSEEVEQLHGKAQLLREEIIRLEGLARERDQMLQSSSWRLTAPLRAAMRRYRNLRMRVAFQLGRLRTAWQRTRASLGRRGLVGTLKRARQEFSNDAPNVTPIAQAPNEEFSPFALPTSETPRVSIVVPVYNKIAYTVACLRSLAQHADPTPFEVIVVDDGSSDATREQLAQIEGVRTVRNAQNLGFVGSCNAGAAQARGEFVFFLNNDTVVTHDWLGALLRCFEQESDAGLVGSKLVYPDGRLQEAGGIVFRDGSGWNYGRFGDPADPSYNFRREVDYCSGAAILIRRELFERLGGFDSRYAPAYYEDTDLAFGVRAAGLKVFYEPRSTVIHFEGVTAGTDTGSGMKRYQVINREKFQAKWPEALATQPAPIDDAKHAPRAATFRAAKRILIVDACTPTPDQDSGSLRMVNTMRLLRSLGWQVSFFADNRAYVENYTTAVQELGVEVLYHPWLSDPVAFFRERGAEFDAILLSRHYIAINYLGLARLYAPRARLIFDTVDLHYLREQRAAELAGSAELRKRADVTRAQEHKLMRECDVTLVVSPVEQELLARELPQTRVEILSNVHEVYGCRRPFGERRDLVFVGSFQHPPNTDAVLWFAREIFPTVRARLPDVRLHVIGKPVPQEVQALASDAVVVHGFVADLEPYMDGCRISVAPLRYGAGVKGKVNMAMSYGLPVVATPMAVEGMHLIPGEEAAVAATAAEYAQAVVQLYNDEAAWDRLSRGGLANVEKHFSFASAQAALERILN